MSESLEGLASRRGCPDCGSTCAIEDCAVCKGYKLCVACVIRDMFYLDAQTILDERLDDENI